VFSLVIVHHQAGVDDAGHPAEQGEQQTKNETQEPAGHEHGDRREDDAKKVAERFQRTNLRATAGSQQSMIGLHRRIDLLQGRPGLGFAGLPQFSLSMHPRGGLVGLRLSRLGCLAGATGQSESTQGGDDKIIARFHQG
jgi:hypothetical protein